MASHNFSQGGNFSLLVLTASSENVLFAYVVHCPKLGGNIGWFASTSRQRCLSVLAMATSRATTAMLL
jgi:hypothetical protein